MAVERKTFPVYGNCEIAISTEQMKDGRWAVVASVRETTPTAKRNIDLPVPAQRFDSKEAAEEYGLRMAKEWIDENTPKGA